MLYYEKKKWSKSIEAMFESKGFENFSCIPAIKKILSKGDNVYVTFDPYHSEMKEDGDLDECLWDTDYDKLMDKFYQAQEEI
jgi:hypothetical protein